MKKCLLVPLVAIFTSMSAFAEYTQLKTVQQAMKYCPDPTSGELIWYAGDRPDRGTVGGVKNGLVFSKDPGSYPRPKGITSSPAAITGAWYYKYPPHNDYGFVDKTENKYTVQCHYSYLSYLRAEQVVITIAATKKIWRGSKEADIR